MELYDPNCLHCQITRLIIEDSGGRVSASTVHKICEVIGDIAGSGTTAEERAEVFGWAHDALDRYERELQAGTYKPKSITHDVTRPANH
jgi:hypothetical protein